MNTKMTKKQKLHHTLIQSEMELNKRKKGLSNMGYRSEVAYTIRFTGDDDTKVRQSFYTFLAEAKAKPDTAPCFSEHEDYFKVVESAWSINFYADDVKWYESFTDVQMHEALLALARSWVDDGVECIGYLFTRIGEETNDTEETWGGRFDDSWLHLRREIVKDWE
jgi:hypothetical protein